MLLLPVQKRQEQALKSAVSIGEGSPTGSVAFVRERQSLPSFVGGEPSRINTLVSFIPPPSDVLLVPTRNQRVRNMVDAMHRSGHKTSLAF